MLTQWKGVTLVTEDAEVLLFGCTGDGNLVRDSGGTMSGPGTPSFKTKLVGKRVIVKVSLFSRAFSGTIGATDETGFCLLSDEMVAALRELTGSLMSNLDAPSVYLPFSTLEWLVFSDAKAAAASA
jgi:hypothetical protein